MKPISVTNDIIPIAEFKTGISKWFKNLQESGHPLIITQNGKPAGVLLSPADYDELVYRQSFLDSVGRGIADAESGRIFSAAEIKATLAARRNKG
ncbi:type II toxin-antitoxin system Phd/YefM family antitoxin [Geobacter grbiciae]|uniref:type II toxin-antitoxin system Phd/YefM family antitoxin n=1 Tax=Geobacter grbiciae TaxID=155042 RepID=UPI001C02BD62|nr:type II toxin-antitoxin system Phd/YefM family antitoxin [Geobacter grbiciae]MBT1076634.1 type II toxin-antitoxin system prevent-host-death family antitoxin [Geobacter grbiciae]